MFVVDYVFVGWFGILRWAAKVACPLAAAILNLNMAPFRRIPKEFLMNMSINRGRKEI
jgi:hypothetical protein